MTPPSFRRLRTGAGPYVRRRASPLIVFALVTVLAALTAAVLPVRHSAPVVASFTLLDGRTATLAQLRGQPVLVTFWATNCAPCIEELPDLIQLYRDLKPQGLELIAVAMPYDPPLNVQNLARHYDIPYPIALDVSGTVLRAFDDVKVVPTTFLLGPQGEVLLRQVGKLDTERVRKRVAPFLLPQSASAAPHAR